ncbi:MAG: hypothetical protein H7244_09425, partial [Herminiimonas sp.]|nr:hypothetical protein [Herminiimonas sp.]
MECRNQFEFHLHRHCRPLLVGDVAECGEMAPVVGRDEDGIAVDPVLSNSSARMLMVEAYAETSPVEGINGAEAQPRILS